MKGITRETRHKTDMHYNAENKEGHNDLSCGSDSFQFGPWEQSWMATPVKDAKIALVIKDDGKFNWDASGPGKPPTEIAGGSTFADGVLTLAAQGSKAGALAGKVAWHDADHFTFRVVGAPPSDPGLKFAR